jgi:hypothetical protein
MEEDNVIALKQVLAHCIAPFFYYNAHVICRSSRLLLHTCMRIGLKMFMCLLHTCLRIELKMFMCSVIISMTQAVEQTKGHNSFFQSTLS